MEHVAERFEPNVHLSRAIQYLLRYIDGQAFRFNKSKDRTTVVVSNWLHVTWLAKRLTYAALTNGTGSATSH